MGRPDDVRDVKTAITRLTNDVGELKGARAEANARAKIALIADELDLGSAREARRRNAKRSRRG